MDRRESPGPPTVLAALYLPGAPCPNLAGARMRWPRALDVARSVGDPARVAVALRAAGLWDEAAVLDSNLTWASDLIRCGRALTAGCDSYPVSWRRSLGRAAPPALWCSDPLMANRWLSVVGSRRPSLAARDFVAQVVLTASAIGLGIASGGAPGVDQAAASGAVGPVVECLPCGLDREVGFGVSGTTRLSGCPPSAGFMVSAAKERNAWLYALGAVTVVVQPRLGQGGTWTGCADALRRRLGTVAVWAPPVGAVDSETHAAIDALVRLGAVPIDGGPCLTDQLASLAVAPRAPRQPSLFGDLIREAG